MQQQVLIRTPEMQVLEAQHGKPIEDILRTLYIDQGLTLEQVGVVLGQTKGTISRWLDRAGITARRPGQKAGIA